MKIAEVVGIYGTTNEKLNVEKMNPKTALETTQYIDDPLLFFCDGKETDGIGA